MWHVHVHVHVMGTRRHADMRGRALCVLYAGSAFMIEYILPSRILFSRSIARLRSASIWRGRSGAGV